MGLELPGWLTEPLGWIGLTWPEADEVKLFEAGQAWITFSGRLMSVAEGANQAAGDVWAKNDGESVDAFHRWWDKTDGPRLRLAEDVVAAGVIGSALIVFAAATLALKIAFIVQLVILAIEVAQAIATAFATFGATTAEVPGFVAATRVICRQLIKQVVEHVTTVIKDILKKAKGLLKKVETRIAKRAERKAARHAAQDVLSRTAHYGNRTAADFAHDFPDLGHGVNPNFGKDPAFGINCQSCVSATDRSLAGDASSAVPRRLTDAAGNPVNDTRFNWPHGVNNALGGNNPLRTASGYDDIATELENAGDGARGIVHGMRTDANGNPVPGHVFNAVNRGGQVHFIDGQTGGYAYLENYSNFEFMRTN